MPRRNPLDGVADKVPSLAHRPGEHPEPKRDRSWDQDNPRFSFRVRAGDVARLAALAGDLGVSRDAVASGLLAAALDAVEAGAVDLAVDGQTTETVDALGRRRVTVRRFVRAAWPAERNE